MGGIGLVFSPSPRICSPLKGAKPVNVQVFKCHIDHGIQDVVVFADAVWMQSLRQHGVSILGDVPVLELIKV